MAAVQQVAVQAVAVAVPPRTVQDAAVQTGSAASVGVQTGMRRPGVPAPRLPDHIAKAAGVYTPPAQSAVAQPAVAA
eukprot:12886045-Alexandrium_andersonii.AAC.1